MNHPGWNEQAMVFGCEGDRLIGIVAAPTTPIDTGVMIIVGGPQYRAGSHRQFTLLARHLAGDNIASFRFDYRGMGDSEGGARNFERVDRDIGRAIETFLDAVPGLSNIVLWGLCDAASASLLYGHTDPRVTGLILLNPWAYNEPGVARTRLRHYYARRLFQASFWSKLLSRKLNLGDSVAGVIASARTAIARTRIHHPNDQQPNNDPVAAAGDSYIQRMLSGLKKFTRPIFFILSGNDLTAKQFSDLAQTDKDWIKALESANIAQTTIPQANHTFSSQKWRDQVSDLTTAFVKNLQNSHP